ncbi:MAG: rod shape-determining protein MreC [Bacteroidia bacterium]
MRNLFVLLLRYHALILFIVLEAVSLSLVFSSNSFQRAALLDATQETVGFAENTFFEVNKFFNLGKVNDSLANELAVLKQEALNFQELGKAAGATKIASATPGSYQLIAAKVIANSTHKRNNFITLDAGIYDGLEKNMAIITSNGIVGTIKSVSNNFASGISVLHSDFAIGARIKELNENGTLVWDGDDRNFALLKDIPGHVKIKKGQAVEVNSYSYIFPESTPIGVVESYELVAGKAFYEIKVSLNNDLRNVNHVFVVKNQLLEEKINLEESIID